MPIRTIKETMLGNIELLPEAALWRPVIEDADDDGFLPSAAVALRHMQRLDIEVLPFRVFAGPGDTMLRVALLHEFWVSSRHVAAAS